MRFSTILFDLGSTLIYTKEPWERIHPTADLALASFLENSGIHLPVDALSAGYVSFINSYYVQQENSHDNLEKTTMVLLQDILINHGYFQISETIISGALDELYAVTQKNWQLEEDALPTLQKLHQHGFRMGLISNTSLDKNVQQLIDRCKIRPYMDFIITSAGFGIRKPDGRIFQAALDHLHSDPGETVMIGDSLEADILGANLKEIFSIFISRRANPSFSELQNISPKATISTLSELWDILNSVT